MAVSYYVPKPKYLYRRNGDKMEILYTDDYAAQQAQVEPNIWYPSVDWNEEIDSRNLCLLNDYTE